MSGLPEGTTLWPVVADKEYKIGTCSCLPSESSFFYHLKLG